MSIFSRIFLSNYWWQKSDIWSQALYRYPISWEEFLDPSDSYFLFADFVDFYTHWTYILYMPIFSRIFFSNYWWQISDIWSQASYRYPISWEAFFDPSDSYFLFAEERGYHRWALAHSSSCYVCSLIQVSFILRTFSVWSPLFVTHHAYCLDVMVFEPMQNKWEEYLSTMMGENNKYLIVNKHIMFWKTANQNTLYLISDCKQPIRTLYLISDCKQPIRTLYI
jgi:hypothetical protein